MKGLAITQIIMLVLGIIVLAVIGFLLYTNFVGSSGQIDVNKCRSLAVNACTTIRLTNQPYKIGPQDIDPLTKCSSASVDATTRPCNFDVSLDCKAGAEWPVDKCKGIVGTS